MTGLRERFFRISTRVYGPDRGSTLLSWLGDERLAIGKLPTGDTIDQLPKNGVTHVVNCRTVEQTWISQDLAVEKSLFGPSRVVHAPMWDLGLKQRPQLWSAAAAFTAQLLARDPEAGVLVHCHQGRRRSTMVAYAVLRLRGYSPDDAITLIATHRAEAQLLPVYAASVERWLAAGAIPVGPLRIG